MRAYTGRRSLLIALSIYLTVSLTFGVSSAFAADGLATDESVPQWANHQFVHFMPPKSTGITPNFAGTHGEALRYWGGTVQTEPELYLLFWGNNFWNGTEPRGLDTELHLFYESLASEIHFPYTQGWQGILSQYTNVEGRYKDARIVGESNVVAPGGAPKNVNHEVVEAEVSEWIREIKRNGKTPTANSQFVVLTAPQSTFTEYDGCGYHSVITYEGVRYSYTLVPYPGDLQKHYKEIGKTCDYLEESSKVKEIGAQYMFSDTGVASHEFAESVTDPTTASNGKLGWASEENNPQSEIADLCANEQSPVQELPQTEGRIGWTYVYLLWDDEEHNMCRLEDPPFPIPPTPSVAVEAASGLGYHQATLNGNINPKGPESHYHFEWGPSSASENSTSEASAGYGESNNHENATIVGLKAGTTYHFRVSASSWVGNAVSSETTFTTLIPPPTVVNEANSNIGDTTGTINGEINPNGFSTTYQVQYWQAGKPYEVTDLPASPVNIGSGEANVRISQTASNLTPFTEYRWHIVATNGGGTTYGPESSLSVGPFLTREATLGIAGDTIDLEGVSCPTASACEVVGAYESEKQYLDDSTYAQKWNGYSWTQQTVPNPAGEDSLLRAVSCTSTTACTAVGTTGSTEGTEVPFAERWNGSSWSVETMPVPEKSSKNHFSSVACNSSTSCWAVGSDEISNGGWRPFVDHWNGTTWAIEQVPALPNVKGQLEGISCATATECEAVGWQYTSGSGSAPVALRLHEGSWIVASPPIPNGAVNSYLIGISCLANSVCETIGEYYGSSGQVLTFAERFTGATWEVQSTPQLSETNIPRAISCTSESACTVVGEYNTVSSNEVVELPFEIRWNGIVWVVRGTAALPQKSLNTLKAVSCATLTSCMAVGYLGLNFEPLVEVVLKPVTSEESATNVTSAGGTINATVNPEGWETTYHFEYGTTTEYGTSVPLPDAKLASEAVAEHVSHAVNGLAAETTYHYRIVATNAAGVAYGSDKTFKTLPENSPPTYVNSFGTEGAGSGQFRAPTGVGLDSSGHIWVDDSNNCRVQEFSEGESYIGAFGGSCGVNNEEWEIGSRALSVDNKGHIYLLDKDLEQLIQERSEAGTIVHNYLEGTGVWGEVYDFAIDAHGDVWVVSNQYDDLLEYNGAGEKIRTVSTKGNGVGQFEDPYGIAIGPNGDIWVTDRKLNKLVELNENGEYVREVGVSGSGEGQFREPTILTIDSKSDLWIVDSGDYRVEELNEKGEYKTEFGAKGKGAGQFESIGGIAINSKRVIYLTDETDDRVEKWE